MGEANLFRVQVEGQHVFSFRLVIRS